MTHRLEVAPARDSEALAEARRRECLIDRELAARVAGETLGILRRGRYVAPSGREVDLADAIARMKAATRSIPPDETLPSPPPRFAVTRVSIANETTLASARRLVEGGARVLALNFADAFVPGGLFLEGSRAQEESLCRATALFASIEGDRMYGAHRGSRDGSSWAVLSPRVPVIRDDDGSLLETPREVDLLSCAAPRAFMYAPDEARKELAGRASRVLEIARAFAYDALVLGAWGCGVFRNDPAALASSLKTALESAFAGVFAEVAFPVTDWSPERRFLGPIRDVFGA